VRLRAINGYRLNGENPSIRAMGHAVFDLGVARRVRQGVELSFALDNFTNRSYYETQNYFESRLPGQEALSRIHATPGYPITAMVGLTFRFRGK
jgi:outer membrane receptor protein involved in Fe transport